MAFYLEFEGIRCFRRKQRVRIAPLTLLVGENSSGKSTVLAVTKIAMDLATSRLSGEPFNEPPFQGAADEIDSMPTDRHLLGHTQPCCVRT